jgi:DNA-binding YbaB/EbfC family protein
MANNPFGNMPGGMAGLMKQAQRMMEDAKKTEEELAGVTVEGASGGGMVKVRATGKGDLIEIKIAKEAVDPEDVEMLEDLVVLAVREALDKATALRTEKLQGVVPPNMNIPGLF